MLRPAGAQTLHRKPELPHKRAGVGWGGGVRGGGDRAVCILTTTPIAPFGNSRAETDPECRRTLPEHQSHHFTDITSGQLWLEAASHLPPSLLPSPPSPPQPPPESSSQATPLMSRFMSSLINQIFQSPFNHQILEITVCPGSQEGQEGPPAQTRWRAPSSSARTPKSNHFHFPKVNHLNSKTGKKKGQTGPRERQPISVECD